MPSYGALNWLKSVLPAGSVSNSELSNMAQATIKGRATGAGTGDPQDLTATQAIAIIATADGTGSGLDADLLDGQHAADFNVTQSTGVLTGGVISIGTGGAGVATTFSITAGTGQIVDNTVNPNTVTAVSWTAKTDVAITNILTQLVTFIAIDSGGNVVQSATDFTPAQQRDYIVIGVAVHSNQTTVNAVNQTQVVAYAPGSQANDLMYSLGLFNISGNVFSANGANMKINKSAGSIFRRGSNYTTLTDNPHVTTTGALTQAPLRMQNQTGAGSASTTDVDVANYDVGGVTTAISPATRFSVLRVFLFQSNLVAVQRGQAVYLSLAEAKAAIQTEAYTTNSILAANGLLRGFIVAQANASSLSDASKCFFIEAGKFGGAAGVGGLSVSTLQNAYDNGSSPEILTDATRLGLSIKRGSGADTDVVLETQNNAGSTTFSVTGAGVVTGTLTNCTGLPTGGMLDASVTLAKMANLAQDQFIGRTTASTGVPETATITAAARTVLDDTTVAAMVDTLGGATSTGTGGIARATSPTFVTPTLGAATATSIDFGNGAVTDLFAGGWTPTLTASVNVAASTNLVGHYIRCNDRVAFSIAIDIDPTAGAPTLTSFELSLPIASNFSSSAHAAGVCQLFGASHGDVGEIRASAANDTLVCNFYATTIANVRFTASGVYRII